MVEQAMTTAVSDQIDLADVERRIKLIFIGSVGNLVEWYDFYAYTAFALYFAPAFFPNSDPGVQQLNAAGPFAPPLPIRPPRRPLLPLFPPPHPPPLSLPLSPAFL